MMNYLKDGACSLSNNLSENSIRPVVLGRKNWLFSDTPDGASASMKIFSMIGTTKANGIDPLKYLNFLLENRLSAEMFDDELETFAPWSEMAQATRKLSQVKCSHTWHPSKGAITLDCKRPQIRRLRSKGLYTHYGAFTVRTRHGAQATSV
jgi:hypothetical protein